LCCEEFQSRCLIRLLVTLDRFLDCHHPWVSVGRGAAGPAVSAARQRARPDKPYLHERFNDGCIDAVELTRKITELGYRGSLKTVHTYLRPFRADRVAPPPVPVAPTVRQVTGWITIDK